MGWFEELGRVRACRFHVPWGIVGSMHLHLSSVRPKPAMVGHHRKHNSVMGCTRLLAGGGALHIHKTQKTIWHAFFVCKGTSLLFNCPLYLRAVVAKGNVLVTRVIWLR